MATKRIALLAASVMMLTSFGAQPSAEESIFTQGEFFIGCSYWAKNAGMYMWSQWRPDVVEKEIGELAAYLGGKVFRFWTNEDTAACVNRRRLCRSARRSCWGS